MSWDRRRGVCPHITSTSPQGREWICDFEGFRADAYQDQGGIWTIGYGFTYLHPALVPDDERAAPFSEIHTRRVRAGDHMDREDAGVQFQFVIEDFERAVDSFTPDWITQREFDALVDWTYNIGAPRARTSTLIRVLQDPLAFPASVARHFRSWIYSETDPDSPGPEVNPVLVLRAACRQQLFLFGNYCGYEAARRASRPASERWTA